MNFNLNMQLNWADDAMKKISRLRLHQGDFKYHADITITNMT
jgi:hypothetical protein